MERIECYNALQISPDELVLDLNPVSSYFRGSALLISVAKKKTWLALSSFLWAWWPLWVD